MAQGVGRSLYTGEVVRLLDEEDFEGDDLDDGLDEVFFPGSDDELGFLEEEIEADEEYVSLSVPQEYLLYYSSYCDDNGDEDR